MELTGKTLGRYRILRRLGEGGMGEVYVAEDTDLRREVALKVLPPEFTDDTDRLQRFQREARAVAALKHPGIVTIYSVEEADGLHFITMELVEGRPISALIEPGGLPADRILDLALPLCEAVAAAHRRGIVHRDLKPDNVMVDDEGRIKVLDFGLAKVEPDAAGEEDATVTAEGRILGTVAYMSPEQAQGQEIDARSDIFSLGILFYELASGERPFRGDNNLSILTSIIRDTPPSVTGSSPSLPSVLGKIIGRCLSKRPEDRYATAEELRQELEKLRPAAAIPRARRKLSLVAGLALIAALVTAALWWTGHRKRVHWARTEAIAAILAKVDGASWLAWGPLAWEAHELATEASRYLGDDPALEEAWKRVTHEVTITSDPAGADVYGKAYSDFDGAWRHLGRTPLEGLRFPAGASRVTVDLMGHDPAHDLVFNIGYFGTDWHFDLQAEGSIPEGMVFIPGRKDKLFLPGIDHLDPAPTRDFLMDRYEVTNRRFKEFVDAGGYDNPEYWKEPFVLEGREIDRETAMARFRDKTGRSGPAAWEVGDYPKGEDDLPVSGISWYEAAAYAEFADKSLPTVFHWNQVALTVASGEIVPFANLEGTGALPVGSEKMMHRWGVFDLAGNVREWCRNPSARGDERFILGGGWNDQNYAFNDAYAQSAWDRSPTNGLRCIRYTSPADETADLTRTIEMPFRDFYAETPVSDETFALFLRQFEYDATSLNSTIESEDEFDDWIRQRVSFDAAYGGERVEAWLFLPLTPPPHSTVIYFPGSGAIHTDSSAGITGDRFTPMLKTGRAVMWPIYKGTYERRDELDTDYPEETVFYKDHLIMWARDLARSIDYMESRDDLDTDRLAFYGVSWGGIMGTILPAVETRIRVNLLYVAGLLFQRALPEADQINYVGRVRQPTLMINGELDFFFPVETSQKPLFDLLGTPAEHKRYVVYPGSHAVPREDRVRELLAWLDKYQPVDR